jgi:hypothetical protein
MENLVLSKHGKVQLNFVSKPCCVVTVIRKMISGFGMNKHRQVMPIGLQPRDQLIELLAIERKLATPAGMRADQFFVNTPYFDLKQLTRLLTDGAGMFHCFLVEVYVSMVGRKFVCRSIGHWSFYGWSG